MPQKSTFSPGAITSGMVLPAAASRSAGVGLRGCIVVIMVSLQWRGSMIRSRITLLSAATASLIVAGLACGAEWEGYEKLTREALLARVAQTARGQQPDIYAKNLSN